MNIKNLFLSISSLVVFIMAQDVLSYANTEITIYPAQEVLYLKPQAKACAIINIQLPPKGYIYANPKGEGTGKATTAYVKAPQQIVPGKTRYLPGTLYSSPLDNKPVYIYKNKTSLCIPFEVHAAIKSSYSLSITIEGLYCNDASCIPIHNTITQTIQVDTKAPEFNTTSCDMYKEPEDIINTLHKKDPSDNFKVIEAGSTSSYTIIHAIIFGIIAGFLLNFMPCVLPVISLKILSFISYGNNNPRQIRIMGILFTAGILTSFLALASLAAYAGYNWGELFQHHTFIVVMAGIIFVLALSFFGVYTFNIPQIPKLQSANIYIDSYFKGIVATLLATPCSGPFLGATLAWSLTQHPIIIFMVFMNIGFGMSLPYLLLSFYPSLIRFIPKPGAWMITFEQFMGFLLIATTIYLLALLDATILKKSMWFMLLLSIGLWQWGRFGNITKPPVQRIISLCVLILIIVFAGFTVFSSKKTSQAEITYKPLDWEAIVQNNTSQVAMVIFTADWCPNCKFVEATALASSEVIEFVHKNNITVYKADITTKNPPAESLLQQLGSHSIPFAAIFPEGENFSQPVILRDIYTSKDLLKALQKALELSKQSHLPELMILP
ncbi:MAG: protein-disulfide reductase DsbD family protein [Spirochaetota bacterium]